MAYWSEAWQVQQQQLQEEEEEEWQKRQPSAQDTFNEAVLWHHRQRCRRRGATPAAKQLTPDQALHRLNRDRERKMRRREESVVVAMFPGKGTCKGKDKGKQQGEGQGKGKGMDKGTQKGKGQGKGKGKPAIGGRPWGSRRLYSSSSAATTPAPTPTALQQQQQEATSEEDDQQLLRQQQQQARHSYVSDHCLDRVAEHRALRTQLGVTTSAAEVKQQRWQRQTEWIQQRRCQRLDWGQEQQRAWNMLHEMQLQAEARNAPIARQLYEERFEFALRIVREQDQQLPRAVPSPAESSTSSDSL